MRFSRAIIYLSIILLCCQATTLRADENFEARLYKSSNGDSINYRIYMPEGMDADEKYPLVMFFHGAGQRGADNIRQLTYGVRNIQAYSKESNHPAIIIAAQVPNNEQWVNTPWGADSHLMPEAPSRPMKLAMELMEEVILDQPVDKERIYVTGMSMGGFGTWDILQRMPDRFAAALIVCGGGDINQAERIKDVPIWAFHGDRDTVVKPKRSRDMIAALKKAGGTPQYTEYKGVDHDSWTRTYADKNVLSWLFSQKKSESGKGI